MSVARFSFVSVLSLCALGCDDYVRFGPPLGLRSEEGGQVEACMPPEVDPMCGGGSPDWPTEIFAPMFDKGATYGCANDLCHSPMVAGGGLRMVAGDSVSSYQALMDYKSGTLTYISTEPSTAYILCNLQNNESLLIGNQPMPVVGLEVASFVTPADYLVIAQWVACQCPPNGTGVVTGGGGAGGAGGALGAGGVGGN